MDATGKLEIRVEGYDDAPFRLDAPGVEGRIIGRASSQSSFIPDIDLTSYGARDGGVSRKHAVLVRYKGKVHIIDLESVNGTTLNGTMLKPQIPYAINDGDRITVGSLNMVIRQISSPPA